MISILCPTRDRPDRFDQMAESVFKTTENLEQVEIVAYLQDDDPKGPMYLRRFEFVKFVTGPRVIMSDLWNVAIPHARGDIFMQCADDVIFQTPGWDLVIEEAFADCPDKILLVHGDDLGPSGKTFATLPFVHRRWFDVIGYFTGPGFSADWSDAWPQDVADMIGRKKLLPIVVEHKHWLWNKAVKDQTYQENENRYRADRPDLLYIKRLPERQADAAKLRKAIKDFKS